MQLPSVDALRIQTLGPASFPSPLQLPREAYVAQEARVSLTSDLLVLKRYLAVGAEPPSFERAGPRRAIFFDPAVTCAGLVTCGGLCPGLNDVVRAIVLALSNNYRVSKVLGFRFGYKGLSSAGAAPMELTSERVEGIQREPGTILGSSRGHQDTAEMIDCLIRHGVNILFVIGGDGTTRGAIELAREAKRRNLPLSIIGVPKTIDNDVSWTTMSFGFFTAVEEAKKAVFSAHAEAQASENGVVVLKLMGRHSGFIAEYAALASSVATHCLIPEVPFELHGEKGLLASLKTVLSRKHHAVVVVAEGAGQHLFKNAPEDYDASGNPKLSDIGVFLTEEIRKYLRRENILHVVRYIDPSYLIRSTSADTLDSVFCLMLGIQAVHAAMAGKTAMSVGHWNQTFVHVPMELMVQKRRVIDPFDQWWQAVMGITVPLEPPTGAA